MSKLLSMNSYHYRRGGSDAVYFDHDEMFNKIDWQTAFFSMHHPKNYPTPWDRYFVDELEFGSDYSIGDKLKMASKVIYSFEAAKKMTQLINDFKPDIAHAHCIYHHLSPSILKVLHDNGVPAVMTAHDLKLACPAYKMLNQNGICEKCKSGNLTHLARNRCIHDSLAVSTLVMIESSVHRILGLYKKNLSKIVVPSLFYKNKLIEWGWDEQKIEYIANFIPAEQYQPNYEPGDYVFYFGRLSLEKGVDTLIKAVAKSKLTLKIAGTGPYEQELRQIVEDTNADVEFLGYRTGEDLKQLIREAKMIVLPSQWYENAPISILEAYASGKVVVGADIAGIPEMIIPGETGFLFKSADVNDLSDVLNLVDATSANTISDMGRQAREHVCNEFSNKKYLQKTLAMYESLGVDTGVAA